MQNNQAPRTEIMVCSTTVIVIMSSVRLHFKNQKLTLLAQISKQQGKVTITKSYTEPFDAVNSKGGPRTYPPADDQITTGLHERVEHGFVNRAVYILLRAISF